MDPRRRRDPYPPSVRGFRRVSPRYCVGRCKVDEKSRSPLWRAVAAGALATVSTFFHYIVMLMAMTMNVYVFTGVVAGHGFGAALASLLHGRDERRGATPPADEDHC